MAAVGNGNAGLEGWNALLLAVSGPGGAQEAQVFAQVAGTALLLHALQQPLQLPYVLVLLTHLLLCRRACGVTPRKLHMGPQS